MAQSGSSKVRSTWSGAALEEEELDAALDEDGTSALEEEESAAEELVSPLLELGSATEELLSPLLELGVSAEVLLSMLLELDVSAEDGGSWLEAAATDDEVPAADEEDASSMLLESCPDDVDAVTALLDSPDGAALLDPEAEDAVLSPLLDSPEEDRPAALLLEASRDSDVASDVDG